MKKKILFVNDVLSIGGVERSLIDALNNLDYDKLTVDVYILHPKYDLLDEIDKRVNIIIVNEKKCRVSLKYICLYLWIKLLHIFSFRKAEIIVKGRLIKQYRKNKQHLFFNKDYDFAIAYKHSESAEFVADVIEAKKKIMFYHHGKILDYELHKRVFEVADKIVAVSCGVADILAETYPNVKNKITVIYNLIDADSIKIKAKEYKANVFKDKTIICSCGRLNPEKGFDIAIAAAKFLKEQKVDFHWYFVGDGNAREELEGDIKKLGLDDKITITGMLKNPLPYVDACDIYVQPSYAESFCLSIAEAHVLNKPVVSTATIGAKYLVEDGITGILTERNGDSIGNSTFQLLINKEKLNDLTRNLMKINYQKEVSEYHNNWYKLLELYTIEDESNN